MWDELKQCEIVYVVRRQGMYVDHFYDKDDAIAYIHEIEDVPTGMYKIYEEEES